MRCTANSIPTDFALDPPGPETGDRREVSPILNISNDYEQNESFQTI